MDRQWLFSNPEIPGSKPMVSPVTGRKIMTRCSWEVFSHSDRETIRLGKRLGAFLGAGDLVALAGEPGSGKTWFTKGVALGIGVDPGNVVTSPSFSLVNEYEGRCALYHMDVYRLETVEEFLSSGLEEYFFLDATVVMEWANRWPEVLPVDIVTVEISIVAERSRSLILSGHGDRSGRIVTMVKRKFNEEAEWG
jgi:tRNA threonylcarbamoyladenosine biosynthesis protein TsaE